MFNILPSYSYHWIIFVFSVILVGFYNDIFWSDIYNYAIIQGNENYFFLVVLFFTYVLILSLCIEIVSFYFSVKFIIGLLIIIACISEYYMNSLDISINSMIIESLWHTTFREIRDFLTLGLFWSFLFYGVFPLWILWQIKLKKTAPFLKATYQKFKVIGVYFLFIGGIYIIWGGNIIFAFKSSKAIIYMTNPITPIRSSIDFGLQALNPKPRFINVGLDARFNQKHSRSNIFVLVIGESARAANFYLNGYYRDTNPYMKKLTSLVNFTRFYSCGVITAISIPCMLTNYTHKTYKNRHQSFYIDNIMDIAQRVGYETYWISNNGGACMGKVCERIKNIKYYNGPQDLDGDMLVEIEDIITNAKEDSFLVINLHGSHGASYYKRYPSGFEVFSPVCHTSELQKCSKQDIVNAYDNSIIYTDYFLYQIVQALEKNKKFSVAMWYLSDHGESLGEYGEYMHGGLPYVLSPDVQKHIPSMIWLGKGFENDYNRLNAQKDKKLSQDYVFHTLLDLLDIQTKDYQKDLDIMNQN
ncbi:sulfatase-like hydrolase/transferase [Helicobacter sp. 13S00477-4]|uniref:phosphoethanolamine transferase n=1 Tax=Helicobacter sp. 13S00477-4 TaxID=1905759 RepID=UPI000BA58B03|nr:sulfatase-like hydrolase/transferase [Helicobacter sp. 13S00477-4]